VSGGVGVLRVGAAGVGLLACFLLRLGAARIQKMNMTNEGRTVFRRKCELTGTKSAHVLRPTQAGQQMELGDVAPSGWIKTAA